MAKISARNVKLFGGGRDLSGRSNSGTLSFSAEAPDVSAFGATYRERVPDGLKDWELSIAGLCDLAANQLDSILFGALGASTRIKYGPGGSTAGCTMYTACAVCSDYSIEGAVEGAVTFSATFAGRIGTMTASTW